MGFTLRRNLISPFYFNASIFPICLFGLITNFSFQSLGFSSRLQSSLSNMSLKYVIQILFTLLPLISAGPIAGRGTDEAVVLANCASSWGEWSSEMAYYSSGGKSPSGTPAATAVARSGSFQTWEGAPVYVYFEASSQHLNFHTLF
jgi:hypothetical protein